MVFPNNLSICSSKRIFLPTSQEAEILGSQNPWKNELDYQRCLWRFFYFEKPSTSITEKNKIINCLSNIRNSLKSEENSKSLINIIIQDSPKQWDSLPKHLEIMGKKTKELIDKKKIEQALIEREKLRKLFYQTARTLINK